jgi:hypothetical protein
MFIGASLLCFAFLLFVSTFLLHFVGVHWHFVVSTFVACWHLIVMCCFCPLAPPCCALLVLVGNSLLHAFLFINTSNLSTFLTPSALYCLLVVHSQCSSMPSYCDVLMLLVNTSFLSFVCVHWHLLVIRQHLVAMCSCCSSMLHYYVFLLFVNTFSLCTFNVHGCLLATCFFFIHISSPSTFLTPSVLHHLLVICSSLKENWKKTTTICNYILVA